MIKTITSLALALMFFTQCFSQPDTSNRIKSGGNKNYKQITHSVCQSANSDQDKAYAIYNWVTTNITLDLKKNKDPERERETIEGILQTRKTTNNGYALLYSEMCREEGLKAVRIKGYLKDWIFDNGDKLYIPRHEWCCVMIDNEWQLVDPMLGSGYIETYNGWFKKQVDHIRHRRFEYGNKERFISKYNPDYFLADPIKFRYTHLPADPIWQLTRSEMSLAVFEAGDSAIKRFSVEDAPYQTNPVLLPITELTEDQKVLEQADRVNKYNDRFCLILGQKASIEANRIIETFNSGKGRNTAGVVTTDKVKSKLKKSSDYLKQQKKMMPEHYSGLQKKNTVKNVEAKKYFSEIKSDDKAVIAKCNTYINSGKSEIRERMMKQASAKKRSEKLSAEKLVGIITSVEKNPDSPELKRLNDSISIRAEKITQLDDELIIYDRSISNLTEANNIYLQKISANIQLADSIIRVEAAYRLKLRDNYDDEIISSTEKYKKLKFSAIDSFQKLYYAGYDTICRAQKNAAKLYVQLMDMEKANLSDLEQYKKLCSKEPNLSGQYAKTVYDYKFCIAKFDAHLANDINFLKENNIVFGKMSGIYKSELALLEDIGNAEKQRKKLENKTIAEKRTFDEKENRKQQKTIDEAIRTIDRARQKLS